MAAFAVRGFCSESAMVVQFIARIAAARTAALRRPNRRVVIHFIRDARHRPNEECGHTAIPQCAIGALFAGNPSQCGGREFDV